MPPVPESNPSNAIKQDVSSPAGPRDNMAHAYESVRNLILEGHLEPGKSISQTQLASTLLISRTPLREALRRLETEGLVQLDFNRRVQVAPLSLVDLEALYSLRLVNEPLAVYLSLGSLNDSDLEGIGKDLAALNAAAEARDETSAVMHHRNFHFGLFKYAADRIRTQVESQWDHSVRYVKLYQGYPGYRLALISMGQEGHQRTFEAAQRRDAEETARLIAEHIGRTALTVIANVDSSYEPRMLRSALRFAMDSTLRS